MTEAAARERVGSTSSTEKDHYPTVTELLAASDINKLLKGVLKESLLCIIREMAAQLREAKSHYHALSLIPAIESAINETSLSSANSEITGQKFSQIEDSLSGLTNAVTALSDGNNSIVPCLTLLSNDLNEMKSKPSYAGMASGVSSAAAEATASMSVPVATHDKRMSNTKREIRISGIPESSGNRAAQIENDAKYVKSILENLEEYYPSEIETVYRAGKKRNTDGSNRPRNLIVLFRSQWLAEKCISKGYMLKDHSIRVFISRSLTKEEQELEQHVLKKRAELIKAGTPREQLRIRNLKLYKCGDEVNINA